MSTPQFSKPPKGQMKCNVCRENCQIKNGDWFYSNTEGSQQVFLCKSCESAAKGTFRKVNTNPRQNH